MQRVRLGMVGGGEGAFIGGVHRIAARLDDAYSLVCGALSSDPERARTSGAALGLDPTRCYDSYAAMFAAERVRPDGMEVVAIVTPNHLHCPVAVAALDAGYHVICDKPLATDVAEAQALLQRAAVSQRVFAVTYNYTGYPMVRQARAMVTRGDIGALRVVQVEYPQAWLAGPLEATGQKQAAWRTDPALSGPGGAIGDIGSHAFHLACFVTSEVPQSVLADLTSFVAGRRVDDNAHVLLRFANGARGALWASQVAHGHENALKLRVYGEHGALAWEQEVPDRLWFTPDGQPKQLLTRGGSAATSEASRVARIPGGHPEGYLEGFATLYAEIARAIVAKRTGATISADVTFPTVADGALGVRFIAACVQSSASDGQWVSLSASAQG
ncbi:MAG TPA: Gfo/Idh/MocA family oxidoreductase [Acetobacteraceae bacterium]|nr:Gfo/Idh/MocA family oxidoreductase [Acetobacteraceae bacterium]